MIYLSPFGLNTFQKFIIVIFGISTLKYVKNEFLTLTLNFGIGPLFLKAFSQDLGWGWGPLYKLFLNSSIKSSAFLSCYQLADVTPLDKKGKKR